MTSKELATKIAEILDERKAIDIQVLDIEELTIIADYFVICTGTSTTHVKALADEVEFKMKRAGEAPQSIQGYSSSNWILLDFGSVIVHVFLDEMRQFYSLERLWADAPKIEKNGADA